ncbi:MAG TPA: phospholipase D-like domain-containing protein [Chloroflexia bacterium]|nr:phospholipase D-like domain-containing protein [Chloroflexia bacterium]
MSPNISRITGPFFSELLGWVRESTDTIRIASPFVKEGVVREVIQTKPGSARLRYLNSFKLQYFYSGASDIAAISALLDAGSEVRSMQRLHAKLYIFDESRALITSANLTRGGLISNYEYGVLISETPLVRAITDDFDQLFASDEETSTITKEHVEQASTILQSAPPKVTVQFPTAVEGAETPDTFAPGSAPIEAGLSGWKLSVFQSLVQIPGSEFSLDDAYRFESDLQAKYPQNRFVRDKIRQQLQYLRDHGILEFLGNGHYRKLW